MSTTVQHRRWSCRIRRAAVKAALVLAVVLVPTARYPVVKDPYWAQVAELTSSDGVAVSTVAIDGDTVVAGAPGLSSGSAGAAYVFIKASTGWANTTQTAKLTASDGDQFLGLAVGISGDTIVALSQTAVYVFVKPASGWANMTETAKLTVLDP